MNTRILLVALLATVFVGAGCSNKKLLKQQEQEIATLQDELAQVEADLEAERQRSEQLNSELNQALSEMQKKEQVWMEQQQGMMQITIDGEVTFSSGSARINEDGKKILDQIWGVLENYDDRDVMIEGHTDNVPIAEQFRDKYKSNWELSSARAHAVLHYVKSNFGLAPSRMGAVGYGEYRPIADNNTPEGRSMNRRVVITVTPTKKDRMVP